MRYLFYKSFDDFLALSTFGIMVCELKTVIDFCQNRCILSFYIA